MIEAAFMAGQVMLVVKYVIWFPHTSIEETGEWLKENAWKFSKDGIIAKKR